MIKSIKTLTLQLRAAPGARLLCLQRPPVHQLGRPGGQDAPGGEPVGRQVRAVGPVAGSIPAAEAGGQQGDDRLR